jgi:hypothetical protein
MTTGLHSHVTPAAAEPATVRPTLAKRWHINKRTIQIALGIFWIIDAGLQFQPRMFGSDFVSMVIAPNASGQPAPIASSVTHMAHFLSRDVALWNTVFGLAQLAIGIGLLRRRTVKVALVASLLWAGGVWWFGEGFGAIFTGHANALMGAPGAVVLYAVIGILVWPTAADNPATDRSSSDQRNEEARTGLDSSAAGHGPLGGLGGLWVWAAIWVFFAVLQFLPQNRSSSWLSDSLSGMADGQPGWYGHFLRSLGHAFTGAGTPAAVVLATLFISIGVGPFVTRRPDVFIGLGMGVAALFWITGQAMGGIMTGMATDPSVGPLLILLGAAYLPRVLAPATAPVPATVAFGGHQIWAALGVVALVIVPAAVAVLPEAPAVAAASGSSMQSMTMSGTNSTTTTPASSGKKGIAPAAKGSTANSMNMSGMAGLGVTDPNWKYTGPPLSTRTTAMLTSVSTATDAGHAMQTADCSATPTDAQVLGAVQYVQATSAAVAKYKNLSAATAAGYIPITNPAYPIVHYLNVGYMNNQDILDPNHVDSLVYAFTPTGPVLVAAMYLLPNDENGPMPYGCLVQWHAHTNLCTSTTTHQIVGFTPCSAGTVHYGGRTPYMTHVWQVPVAGGPLAIDPSDLQVMQAAMMAQQDGQAPSTPAA